MQCIPITPNPKSGVRFYTYAKDGDNWRFHLRVT